MKKNISINFKDYKIDLITNGKEEFDKIVLCFHGFNGDKWSSAYSGLKYRLNNTLVVSFDSCGHGKSEVSSEDMRLDLILEEIDAVVSFLKEVEPNKPLYLAAVSYGAYRVMNYLIKYKPEIKKVIYVNPAFRMLKILEQIRDFKYEELKPNQKVIMKESENKFLSKDFIDDLYENNLYSKKYDINYDTEIVVGSRDSLIPLNDTLEIAGVYNYNIVYVDDEHSFENKEHWAEIAKMIEGVRQMKNIIVGGTVRAGKTTLANLIRDRLGYSKVESDTIVNAFDQVFPELGITHRDAKLAREKYEPFLFEVLTGFYRDLKYANNVTVFPGSQFLPENLSRYEKIDKFIVIFLGLDGITPEQLLEKIREKDTENDWTHKKTDEWMLHFCKKIINESERLKADCEKFGFYYFNTFFDRQETLNKVCDMINKIQKN